MAYPPVVTVDENDNIIGSAMLREVWDKGLYHRIALVMVEDREGHILLQKRSEHMELFPSRWEVSASGHVDEGFTYKSAAMREIAEELGIHTKPLFAVGKFFHKRMYEGRTLNYFAQLYRLTTTEEQFQLDPQEVSEVRWFDVAEVKQLVHDHPQQVTDALKEVMDRYYL